jgi:hypothetical protein
MFFKKIIKIKNKSRVQKMTKPGGNLLDILLGLGLKAFSFEKKTLQSCTKSNL